MIDAPASKGDSRNANSSCDKEHGKRSITIDVSSCNHQNGGNYKSYKSASATNNDEIGDRNIKETHKHTHTHSVLAVIFQLHMS